jgi:hypothetical protein
MHLFIQIPGDENKDEVAPQKIKGLTQRGRLSCIFFTIQGFVSTQIQMKETRTASIKGNGKQKSSRRIYNQWT